MGKRKSSKMFNLFSRFGRRRQRRSEVDVVDIDTFSPVITDCQPSTSTAPYPTDYYAVYSESSASSSLMSVLEFLREKDNDTSKTQPESEMPSGRGKCPPGAGKHSKKVRESPQKIENVATKARDLHIPSGEGKSCGAGKKSKMVSVQESPKRADNKAKDVTHLFLARESGPPPKQPPPKPVRLSFFERLKRFGKNKVAPQPRVEEKSSVKISIVPELAGFRGEFLASTVELPEAEASSAESSVDLSRLSPAPAVVQDYYPSTLVGFFER